MEDLPSGVDEDAFFAALDLIGRAGARQTEFGYLNEEVPVEEADWWAKAQYRGARVMVEHHRGPVEAVEALARRLLSGGMCTHCQRGIALSGESPDFCRWTRVGRKWERGCRETHTERMPEEKIRELFGRYR